MKFLNEVKENKKAYERRLNELQEEKAEAEDVLKTINQRIAEGMERDALGVESYTNDSEDQAQKAEAERKIKQINDKIEIVEDRKKDVLFNNLPQIKEKKQEALQKQEAKWQAQKRRVDEAKAALLLEINELGDVAAEGSKIVRETNETIETVNPDDQDAERSRNYEQFHPSHSTPFLASTTFSNEGGEGRKGLLLAEQTARKAYKGSLPSWVLKYAQNGELNE